MSGWPQVALSDCCEIVGGATPSTLERRYWGGAIHWATPKDLSDLEGDYLDSTARTLTPDGLASCSASVLPVRSVLFSSRAPIGLAAINRVPVATNQGFKSLIPRPGRIHAEYLLHWLRAHRPMLESLGNGATFKEVSKSIVSRVTLPLPPLGEQRRIAEVLDRAETLRAQRRQALAHLDALAESIFLYLFNDSSSKRWMRLAIGEVAMTMRTGPFGSQLLHSEFVESGVAVLGIDNVVQNDFVWARPRYITESKFKQLQKYRVTAGDVLVTIMGTCGRCAIVPDDVPVAINTKHLCCIRLDQSRCLPSYLQAVLLTHPDVLHRLGVHERGAVMPGLNMQVIRELEIPLPPLPVQERFRAVIVAVKQHKAEMAKSLQQLDALFACLQNLAFRGEL